MKNSERQTPGPTLYILKIVSLPEIRGENGDCSWWGRGLQVWGVWCLALCILEKLCRSLAKHIKKNLSRETKLHVKKMQKLIHI